MTRSGGAFSRGGASFWLPVLALLSVGSLSWCQQAIAPKPSSPSPAQIISALRSSLIEASGLVAQLQASLALQTQSYDQLSALYAKAQDSLAVLQQRLDAAQTSSTSADERLQRMQSDLDGLQKSLRQTSDSLTSYKRDSEAAVRDLEIQAGGWKLAAVTFAILAAGEAVYIAGHMGGAW